MTTKVRIPTFNSETDEYETYKSEIDFWKVIGKVDKKEQALMLVYELKKDDPSGIRDKVLNEIEIKDLNCDTGVDTFIVFMDKHFKKDESVATYEAYLNFEKCKREGNENISAFCMRFDKQSNIAKKKKVAYPQLVLAFKLLDNSGLTEVDRKLVLSDMVLTDKEAYETTKKALIKYKSDSVCSRNANDNTSKEAIKVESENMVLISQVQEEALMAAGWARPRSNTLPPRGGRGGFRGRYGGGGGQRGNWGKSGKNPKNADGEFLRCYTCESTYHMRNQCPHNVEDKDRGNGDNRRNDKAFVAEVTLADQAANHSQNKHERAYVASVRDEYDDVILYSGNNKDDFALLCKESVNLGLLDTGCTSNVCGVEWIETIKAQHGDRWKANEGAGDKSFKFGGDEILKSQRRISFECNIAGNNLIITTDVVNSSIPLLMSTGTMKRLELLWDIKEDRARILGKWINLVQTSVGHYGVKINPRLEHQDGNDEEESLLVGSVQRLENSLVAFSHDDDDLEKKLRHIHRQFGHPREENWTKFMKLCKEGMWTGKMKEIMSKIYRSCKVCTMFQKTPSRPVVKLQISCEFNKVVTMDLKEKKVNKFNYILHIIDGFTRMSCSRFITNKKPETIVNAFAKNWVSVGYGNPGKVWTDVGGEFNNEDMKALGEAFGFEVSTGAGYSAWMNGLNERNHGVIDKTYEKIMFEHPRMDPEVALAWAVNAKNSLPMNSGFSSFQLVFGKNPSLPSILSDKLPALEGVTTSKAVAEHINALHAGRKAFAEAQCDESIRRALRHRVRAAEKFFKPGSRVYYKRDGQDRWRGVATVIGNDGSVYYLRHQGNLYRVSATRIKDIEHLNETPVNDRNKMEELNSTKVAKTRVENSHAESSDDEPPTSTERVTTVSTPADEHVPAYIEAPDEEVPVVRNPSGRNDQSRARNSGAKPTFPKVGDRISYRVGVDDWYEVDVFGKGKSGTKNESYLNLRYADGSEGGVFINQHEWKAVEKEISTDESPEIPDEETVTDSSSDDIELEEVFVTMIPRSQHNLPPCVEAKDKELKGWLENDTFIEVKDEGQQTIPSMWVLNEKMIDGENKVKARIVAKGNYEEVKVQADAPTGGRDALHVVLAISASKGWVPKTSDVKNAFLQGKPINREVFMEPPNDMRKPGMIWKLQKCVYGLDDAGRSWFLKVAKDLKDLKCNQSKADPCLFSWYDDSGALAGIVYLYVDDFLHMGEKVFEQRVVVKIHQLYKIGKLEVADFFYTGLHIQGTKEGIKMDQLDYIANLEKVDIPKAGENANSNKKRKSPLRSIVGQANWAARRTRPDVNFDLMELSMKFNNISIPDLIRANTVVDRLINNPVRILFAKLDNPQHIITYSDASFANLVDGVSSGRGHIIFLADKTNKSAPLGWTANKVKRVVGSTLAAEALSLNDCLSHAQYLRFLVAEAVKKKQTDIAITSYVDSDNLFKSLHSTSLVSDQKLRIDIGAIRQAMEEENITVKWISKKVMLADSFTKKGASSRDLMDVLQSGRLPYHD